MSNINKVSQAIKAQTPDFIETEYPLFNKFIQYYYRSQEKTGLGQNILNNFLQYLDIDKLDIGILDGATKVVEAIKATDDTIVVESVDKFLENNGSVLIGDEIVYYERTTHAPNIALSPGISYDQVKLKWTGLASPLDSFDGTTTQFPLTSQDSPIAPITPQHLIVSAYGKVLIPAVDYTINGTNIVFTEAPRTRIPSDGAEQTYINFLSGFIENTIVPIDNLSNSFGESKRQFTITRSGERYEPIVDEYVLAIYDNRLLTPKVDFFIDGDQFIFLTAPLNGRFLSLFAIEAPVPSFGSGAIGYARISDSGTLTDIVTNVTGSEYRFEYPPKVSISSTLGSGAAANALVNGVKSVSLLDGGKGYSDSNPPIVQVQSPTKTGSTQAKIKATVTNGAVTGLEILNSGSGYTFTPRLTFRQPGGGKLAVPTITNGSIDGIPAITDVGFGYTTAPTIYVDEPTGSNPIKASLRANLATDGTIASITVLNAGQGYTTVPRLAIIDPVGAQILQTSVDGDGRVINIELLDGGSGYEDIPSVYIVDGRTDAQGNSIGGTGATAVAAIFNGKITDINITAFGTGYSAAAPPSIIIQTPPAAEASAEIGLKEITGFTVTQAGKGYSKAQLTGCARAASGITSYTEDGNAVFSSTTTAAAAIVNTPVKCLDQLFVKRLLDKYTEQFLPDVPELDYTKIDVRTSIKTIKDFYSAKGTSFSIAYLFKLLYGETVSISYPKDQIIKPSDATWSIDTILRATKVSGASVDIKDALLIQEEDISDSNIKAASALVENYISIKTSEVEIFELVLSEETINGSFTVPYKTKLAEPLSATDSIITVDSTIGWPERNGEFVIGSGATTELVQYKEKSLNQFIECTRSVNGVVEDWDSASQVTSNFKVYLNKGTLQEVVMNVVGIVDAQQTALTDTGSYYLPGDKLTVSKLGGTGTTPDLTTWLYNVKKLISVNTVTFGGINNQSATLTCANPHGLLVGDQVTVYGANPIIYNGTFLVTSRDSEYVFQYNLPQPATVIPQGNILVSVDLNKGKSDNSAVLNAIGSYTTNVQNSFFDTTNTYVASTGIPNYKIGPFPGSALLPGNQRKLNRFPKLPTTISTKNAITSGPVGTWVNGVSIWSYKSTLSKTFGAVTGINITNAGAGYDAASPPAITIAGGSGSGATANVTVDGSISEVTVTAGGSGYSSSPLVSIVGGGGSGAAATAIITKGIVSSILINQGGSGYTSQPSITIVGGGGTGATGTASVRGPIQSIAISNGGASYTSNPSVTLSSGVGAVAQAIVTNGRIISIAIISAGSGYTTAPEVAIQGQGFGAVARATIDTDGENAGRVTGITIVNKGINYVQGTTIINLTSVGQGATFTPNVFQWTYNLQATSTFDDAKGAVFEGFNNQYGGEYAHLSNPQKLRYILGDNLFENASQQIKEQETQLAHSPIIGWAFDGNPIYGPYGYSDPTNQASSIAKLNTSYRLKTNLVYDATTNPYPSRTAGPLLNDETAGNFVEDYEYVFGLGDLDQYNGRFCKTPDFTAGRYCYFVTIDSTEDGNPLFPYVLGPSFNSVVDKWNLVADATQQNIPSGVVRYRDPYENVDIDVTRTPNASTNALTTEAGEILLFDAEDENRDGVISQDEIDDPEQMFEESPLQLFDYFPTVKFDSKVDIEVETITKFEDASVTGFTVENPGINYQVNDRLVFDNTDTDGDGVSARVSRIKGETVETYSFENVSGSNYGTLKTNVPHNLIAGDSVFIDYTPIMDNTNKTFKVRQFKGIEQIVISQTGSGYNEEIPPTIVIDGDGSGGALQAVVSSVGAIDTVNITNSGSGYTANPRVILSHPQIYKKADYYVSKIENNNYVKINDCKVNIKKEIFTCGKTLDADGNTVGFVAKLSATGVKEWEKTLESASGLKYVEFERLYVDGDNIWVVGNNKPNSSLLDAYNPDIILCKYVQAENGLSATLGFQKAYAGISGATRSDNVTAIKKYSDSRYVIGGYTNTNSAAPYDAFIATIDTTGNFSVKRKLASATANEKITDLIIDGTDLYFTMEVSSTSSSQDINQCVGKATIGTSVIEIAWIKEYSNATYSFLDSTLCIDEFKEIYLTASCRMKSDDTTRDSFWVGKVNSTDGALIWNYRYLAPGREVHVVDSSEIDLFGDLNIAFTRKDNVTTQTTVDTVKIGYDGKIKNHTTNNFNLNNIEGVTALALDVDESGDVHVFGQTQWNRNECIFDFANNEQVDRTGHYTLTSVGATNAITYTGNLAKIYGYNPAGSNATWVNSYLSLPSATLGTKLAGDWTLEFMVYKNATESQTLSQSAQTLCGIGGARDATGGLWLGYDNSSGELQLVITNSTTQLINGSGQSSSQTNMYADNSWQFVALTKNGNEFKAYINGIAVITGTLSGTSLGNKNLYIGNQVGFGSGATDFAQSKQGQFYVDNIRLRNRFVTPTVPTDVVTLPPTASYSQTFDWVDDAWFTNYLNQYDNIDYVGWGIKVDKNAESGRIGTYSERTNTKVGFVRTAVTPVTGSAITVSATGYSLGDAGLQTLDFDDTTTTMSQDTENLTYTQDIWGSRTATVPSPGSQKLKVSAVVKDRYYFKVTDTVKIDNIQILTINQAFNFTVGAKLQLYTGSTFKNSGYIIRVDNDNNKIYVAVNNNLWSDDLNTGQLSTVQFSEQSTYNIVGPIPNDINEIIGYTFAQVVNQTPGTFIIPLSSYPLEVGGANNLHTFATFKPYSDADYSIRIDEVSGSSPYIVGSVVTINSGDISYNSDYSQATIVNLTGVLKITLVANLIKILQVTAVANSDEVYVITATKHYLEAAQMLYVDGNPSRTVGGVVYDEYDGAFPVDTVVSSLEFTYKLPSAAISDPETTTPGNVNIFVKSPVLKMYYGHQYLFDLSHSSLVGGNLSFAKDNLYKLEYSFNSIERIGTPGVTGQGQPTPTVKLKVDESVVTNISYYFDPSRTGDTSPVIPGSYLDVVDSPYKGTFQISSTAGQTITTGPDIFKFPLLNEPEGAADVSRTTYSTSSLKAVGSINNIRIVNSGGFYTKLPVITGIVSTRKIERIQINAPGTEYAVGEYNNVPIAGDGEGGLVSITVDNGTDDEGTTIPGQIQKVEVIDPGKGYTTASIDINSISGILGSGLTGSGAELVVVIPSAGSGASIFTKGTNVGKIKKLKNNNFGYDYPHDYTLRPEITFPINAQLTSTSILSSITVTDPGSGYSLPPAVVITGGGGTGAVAEAFIKNGRLDTIIVKDPGAGYSSTPTISLKSSFNYVVNLDLGLLQFAYPHGITNGAAVTVTVTDTGDGADFPLAAGATGRLNASTTYYAIAGAANSLEGDQLKLAITASNAALGDALSFVNAGEGRQSVLTESFGGGATANVITSTFLEGELIYQGDTFETATASGYVSTNSGWQVGPRIIKIVDYTGSFAENEKVTGVISKSSGTISDLKIAKGVLEIGSITKTTGQFIDDVGKPSEIIQKIQDSYYYQDFSYAVKSAVSISDWKEILIKNVHPASFKVFGELNLNEYGFVPNKETFFQLTKSVELAQESIVPNIQNFALVEPIYSDFNNTEVLFRQKRLTSSEDILTSVVQRVDDISTLFDGERISFPLTVDGSNVVANANQLMIVLNGVVQNPKTAFSIQQDSIVFSEPPQPPASVKYANISISQKSTVAFTFTNQSGIYPSLGNILTGISSGAKLTVTTVVGTTINGYINEGTFIIGELCNVSATGFNANLATNTAVSNIGLFTFGEQVTNLTGDTAKVEQINLESGAETPLAKVRYTIGLSTVSFEVVPTSGAAGPVPAGTFTATKNYQFGSEIFRVDTITDGSSSTTLAVTRAQLGTTAQSVQENTPIYGTDISVTNTLTLSKTAGTYKSTPGLFDIQLNDVILGASSGVVATVTATAAYQDPTTQEFIGQVNISEGSSFFGLLFNRITSQTYPNVVLDDISKSQISVVNFTDNSTAFDSSFPANERINNYTIPYDNAVGTLAENENIRNYKIEYGNSNGDFIAGEDGRVRKLSFTDSLGTGFFNTGQVIRTRDTKAEVIGFNQARNIVYLGKIGRCQASGADYYDFTFENAAAIDTAQKKFGTASLEFAAADYIVNASTDEIAFGSGAFTVEMYIRPATASVSGTADIFDTRASSANEVAFRLYLEAGQVRVNVNNSDLVTSGATTISANTWTHIAYVKSSTTGKIYINGVEAGTGTDSTTYVAKPIRIGADWNGANGFVGHVDEVRVSTTNRYTGAFTPVAGIFQGDANTKLLLHCDGNDGVNYIDDWSGVEGFTQGEFFNNDAILATVRDVAGKHIYNGSTSTNAITITANSVQKDVTDATYDPNTGDLVLTIGSHSFTTSDTLKIGANKLSFTCAKDNHQTSHTYPRLTDPAYDTTLAITAVSGTTLTVNVGIANNGFNKNTQRYINAGDLVLSNLDFISQEVVYLMKKRFPNFTVKGGSVNCADDIVDVLKSVVSDIRNGSNSNIWDASAFYVDRTTTPISLKEIKNEVTESIWAFQKTQEMVQYIGTNTLWEVQGDHGLTQVTDTTITDSTTTSFTQLTPTDAVYDAATGELTLTKSSHGIVGATSLTASNAAYVANTGVLTVTSNSHGLSNGDRIKLVDNSLTFTCSMDQDRSEHTYPRISDEASSGYLAVSGVTTNTFNVNVGVSPIKSFTPTSSTYDPETGWLKLGIGDHSLEVGTNIKIANNSLKYLCAMGGTTEYKTYPRTTDPIYNDSVPIVSDGVHSTATNASYTPSTGALTITSGTNLTPTLASYVAKSGVLTLTIPNHGMVLGDKVKIEDGAITFTCDMDDNATLHPYPRSSDPLSGDFINIANVTTNTFDVNVGASPLVSFNPTAVTYTPTSGDMVMTIGAHNLTVGTSVRFEPESLTFTCTKDSNATEHKYPRVTDPVYDAATTITAVTSTSITVNVGPANDATAGTHTFVAKAGTLTPTSVTYNPTNGLLAFTVAGHGMLAGQKIKIADNSLTFTCGKDNNATNHTYPRITDPISSKFIDIQSVTTNTFTIQVLDVVPSTNTTTHSFVSAAANCVTRAVVTTGGDYAHTFVSARNNSVLSDKHGYSVGDKIRIAEKSLTFTCAKDNDETEHSYPRSTDPFYRRWLRIDSKTDKTFTVNVGISPDKSAHTFKSAYPGGIVKQDGSISIDVGKSPTEKHDMSNATFDPSNGNLVLTLGSHNLQVGQTVRLADRALTFTCAEDSNASNHSYPRPFIDEFTPSTATYSGTTGLLVFTVNSHGVRVGDWIKLDDNSLTFTCQLDNNQTNHTYPRSTDPVSGKWLKVSAVTTNTFTVQVLQNIPSTNTSTHAFVSAVTNCIKQKRDRAYDAPISIAAVGTSNKTATGATYAPTTGVLQITSNGHGLTAASQITPTAAAYVPATGMLTLTKSSHGYTNGDRILITEGALTFSCNKDNHESQHSYPRATDPSYLKWLTIGNVTTNTFDVNIGIANDQSTHVFISATTNGVLKANSQVKFDADSLTFTCTRDSNATNHTYPRATDPVANEWTPIVASATNTFDVNVGITGFGDFAHTYVSATSNGIKVQDGTITLNVNTSSNTTTHAFVSALSGGLIAGGNYDHTFIDANNTYTPSTVSYTASTGNMVLTVADHGFKVGEHIKIADGGVTFTCAEDSNATNHAYPRSTDPISNRFVPITAVTTNTFTINVLQGTSPTNTTTHAFVSATTGCITRSVVSTGGDYTHTFVSARSNGIHKMGTAIKLAPDSLTFRCHIDGKRTDHAYPRITDPAYNSALRVRKATTNTFTVDIGKSLADTVDQPYTPTAATYDPANGNLVLTIGQHDITDDDSVTIDDNSLTFTCAMDNNQSNKTYPRTNFDEFSAKPIPVASVGTTSLTPSTANYEPTTGILRITSASHGLVAGDRVKFDTNAVTFTCAQDSNGSNHSYPRVTDPSSNRWLDIFAITADTFEVNVGISSNITAHTFVSATSGGVKKQDGTITVNVNPAGTNATFTPSAATYDAYTGDMTLTVGSGHGMSVGSSITIANNGLTFNCTMDGGSSNKTYPRSTDPYGNLKSIPVKHVGHTHATPTNVSYTPASGAMTITLANHGWSNGDWVMMLDGALTMTCDLDGNQTDHAYPRATDPYSNKWMQISNVATNTFDVNVGVSSDTTTHTFKSFATKGLRRKTGVITVNVGTSPIIGHEVSAASFTPASGVLVLTIGDHNLTVGTSIRIANNSLTFTCAQDSNGSNHSYPRANGQGGASADDPAYNDAVNITAVTGNTITVNVGTSSNTTAHTFVSANSDFTATNAAYNPTTGVMTITVANHGFVNGEKIKIADNSLSFTCALDGNTVTKTYPRKSDPVSGKWVTISGVTTNTFDVQVLDAVPSTNVMSHAFQSATANGIKRAVISSGGDYTHTFVSATTNAVSFLPQSVHTFVSANYGAVKKIRNTHQLVSIANNAVTVLDYNWSDCTDVYTTIDNLMDILVDTVNQANLTPAVDHLATVTKLTPKHEFLGGKVSAYYEVPFPVSYHDATNDIIVTNQIDETTRNRFRDAAALIRSNTGPIVDKTSHDMLTLYPDLVTEMPRNVAGSTDGTLQCKTDLTLLLEQFCKDIEDGGNLNSTNVAKFYLGTNDVLLHIRLQVFQSIYAHNRLAYYMKQAILGDLTYDNTDDIIVGDWGITQDGGGCANVQSAIDTLVTQVNDIIAPTSNDYAIAADRLYFNRKYMAEEITGLITQEFTYVLNSVNYNAHTYPSGALGEGTCQRDIKLIILGMISDLQTGGNNSTIAAMENYLTSAGQLNHIETELLATVYGIEQIKIIGEHAIRNRLVALNGTQTAQQYVAQHTDEVPYTDALSPVAIEDVVRRLEELTDIAVTILAPSKMEGRGAAKNLLYNRNYYKEEITTLVNSQFGSGAWVYNTFIDQIVDDTVHDIITTDMTKTSVARNITISEITGNFKVGETVTSDGGGTAIVQEFNIDTEFFVCSIVTGTEWKDRDVLTGNDSGATATIDDAGIGLEYKWYDSVTNVKTLGSARLITSNVSGQIAGTNLLTNPEQFSTNWTGTEVSFTDDALLAPDGTLTADKLIASSTNSDHTIHRVYNLSAYDTFDDSSIKWDADNQRFDEGASGTSPTQQYTYSVFLKKGEYDNARVMMSLNYGTSSVQNAFFDVALDTGVVGSLFTPQNGVTGDAYGVVPLGDGWYRAYITITFSFGFAAVRSQVYVKNASGAQTYAGNNSDGIYVWGAKLNKNTLDPYESQDAKIFYSDSEYNIKNYALDLMETYMSQALNNGLTSPSPNSGFYKAFYDTAAAHYNSDSVSRIVRYCIDIVRQQLTVDTSYTNYISVNGVSTPTKTYGTRSIPQGVGGGIQNADYMYGLLSNTYGELENLTLNEGKIVQVFQRFRIDGDITDGPYTMGEVVKKQGAPSITGVVYGFWTDANYKYLDVKITNGPWAITDNIVGDTNSTTAQISAIEDRIHVIDLKGVFEDNVPFKGYTSGATATPTGFLRREAAVLDNTGGTLTVDTATLTGEFETTAVVYPESSRQYIEVVKYAGLDIGVGARIASNGYIRLGVTVLSGLTDFTVGNRLYRVVSGIQDQNTYGIITSIDLDNNYIYMQEYLGTFTNGDVVGDYGLGNSNPIGYASINTKVVTAGAAAAVVQDIRTVGINKRLYLSSIAGTFDGKDSIKGPEGYASVIDSIVDLKARVKRSFKGFDGTTTNFKLTQQNGTPYLPDPAGHLLVFINGILQPPGASNAYTAFSDTIQFQEAPDLGASFTGFYVGKLRQLDDISFEFDSLRQSFNLKRNDVFYSLTLTDGVQSSTIRPENNIIVSLNGVIQEPGIGFEIVGSRILFSEIPRVGSTFVAFSYVGSEADVDAAEVVPPVEPGDFIDIQGETSDREVAVIESSNSLITFDYLGSVFGSGAIANANLTSGTIRDVQVTSGGSGYTTRPSVRIDSISGFEGSIRALVGVAGVEVSNVGSGYSNPTIAVETSVPDDWTAPDLSLYGEEAVDPETPL